MCGSFVVNNSEVMCEVVFGGFGIVLLLDFSVWCDFDVGWFVVLFDGWWLLGVFGDYIFVICLYSLVVLSVVCVFVWYLCDWFVGGFFGV